MSLVTLDILLMLACSQVPQISHRNKVVGHCISFHAILSSYSPQDGSYYLTRGGAYFLPLDAVVVDIAVELRDGLPVGDNSRKVKEEWAMQGYKHSLWSKEGHSGIAIVEFTKDWAGFKNAIMFEKAFEMENHGKRDWYAQRDKVDNLYAWIARDEEYNSKCLIGKYLRKHANLTTIPEIEREEKRRDVKLVCSLNNELEMKDKQREDIKRKISRTEIFLWSVMCKDGSRAADEGATAM